MSKENSQNQQIQAKSTETSSILKIDTQNKNDTASYYDIRQSSCLDSPSSIISPSIDSDKTNDFSIIRKLGNAEVIYDYEHNSHKNVILIDSFVIESKINLYANLNLLNKAIFYWKQQNLLLRSAILTLDSQASSAYTRKEIISSEKYFVYANENRINNNDNCKYYRLNLGGAHLTGTEIEEICHEMFAHEYNIDFIDSKNGPLWRLNFIETTSTNDNEIANELNYSYYVIFTAHHSIADARNAHYLFTQLFSIIDNVFSNINAHFEFSYRFEPSIEDRLFNNDPVKLSNINMAECEHFNGNTCKIIKEFSYFNDQSRLEKVHFNQSIKFESVVDDYKNDINFCDVRKNLVRVHHFTLNDEFKSLLRLCKINKTKMTACINMITALATRELYKQFTNDKEFLNIHYHLLANLRPFLDPPIDNFIMGYWAVVFGLNFFAECDLNDKIFWSKTFWEHVKHEANALHERIRNNEHFEAAKFDNILFQQISNEEKFVNGGGVHYALSNLGVMPSSISSESKIKIKKHFFGTSLQENRWSSLIFHGLTTIDDSLCWSITYNSNLFTTEIIETLVSFIKKIIQHVIFT